MNFFYFIKYTRNVCKYILKVSQKIIVHKIFITVVLVYSIAYKLRRFRENSGYTQQQMADALNIDRSTYAYYETGKTNPSLETLMKIKDILNVSLEDLLESESKPKRFFDATCDADNFDRVYELNKKEKSLVSLYRSLAPDIQDKILENVSSKKKTEEKGVWNKRPKRR